MLEKLSKVKKLTNIFFGEHKGKYLKKKKS